MHHDAGAVKTAAALEESSPRTHATAQKKQTTFQSSPLECEAPEEQAWFDRQQRQQQRDEPPGGPSTSQPTALQQRQREPGRVKFAAGDEDEAAAASTGTIAAPALSAAAASCTLQDRRQQQQQQRTDVTSSASSTRQQGADAAAGGDGSSSPRLGGFFSRMKKSLGDGILSRSSHAAAAADGSGTSRRHLSQADSQADWAEPGSPGAGAKGAEHPGSVTFASSLRGLLGGASSRLLGSLMGRASSSSKGDAEEEEEEELWFTSLDDFKPICHMLHRGRYMTAYFACASKTGQHFLLKKYDKHKMVPAEERGVRRSIAFSELLQHPNLVRCMGQWEEADTIYVVEEYVGKGDIFNDCISHPEKYTERHVAINLVKPLLKALAYLHANNIIHRSVLPENLYMGIDDVLRLGHLTLAVDQLSDRPKTCTALLDYMAPEMLSVKPHNEHELALGLLDDSSSSEAGDEEEDGPSQQQQQQQQQNAGLQRSSGPGDKQTAAAAIDQDSSNGGAPQQPSRQGSRSIPVLQDAGNEAAAAQQGSRRSSNLMRSSRSLNAAAAAGRAEWEHRDYYDEKVDIWQVGCMVHELLCGSMPFEVESKIDSAGLALWADIEQPPGSLPPDCVSFLQQALTKDPRQRPSAEQLQSHPWIARCESGEPWRDPVELEAARLAAELATPWGWLCHNSKAAVAAASSWVQGLTAGKHRGTPLLESWEQHRKQQQQQQELQQGAGAYTSGPSSPAVGLNAGQAAGASRSSFAADGLAASGTAAAAAGGGLRSSLQLSSMPQEQQQQQQQQHHRQSMERPATVPPLKLTADVVGALNADWAASHQHSEDEEYVTACVVTASPFSCTVPESGFVSSSVSPSKTPARFGFVQQQQQQQPQRLLF